MNQPLLSLSEHAVLALVAEEETHGFAVARHLSREGDVGRILTVRRPQVYRALDRLVALGLAEPTRTEPGEGGPQRRVHRASPEGSSWVGAWLEHPVERVREIRIEFRLKLVLLHRVHRSPLRLIVAQKRALEPAFTALEAPETGDHIDLWRYHSVSAVAAYLDDLERVNG